MEKHYFNEAISYNNLLKALKKSCSNVRWKTSVSKYEYYQLANTWRLRQKLLNGTYQISQYQHFTIFEPKRREIVATRIVDRQFQRSLCDNGLYDDIVEHFISDNVACQKGKGTDYALDRVKYFLHNYYMKNGHQGYVLKCDIYHFFKETNHKMAKEKMKKYISDREAYRAVCDIIDSFDGDCGIGLGSQISQLIQLAVLNDIDHFIKERLHIKYYIRYMDDFILIHSDREYLTQCLEFIKYELDKIGLQLNEKTCILRLTNGFKFLQWKFVLFDTGKVLMLINKKKITKERKRLIKLLHMEDRGIRPRGTAAQSLQSWIANASKGNTYKVCQEMIQFFRDNGGIYNERQ